MTPRPRTTKPLHERTLSQLCNLIIAHKFSYDRLAELLEDRVYEVAGDDGAGIEKAVRQLRRLVQYYGRDKKGGRDRKSYLADVLVMIGETYLYHDNAKRSIRWFKRAIAVRETFASPYHSLGMAYMRTGNLTAAIRSFEEELLIAPGNLYSYLQLAELYERVNNTANFEETLHRLLVRDPDNIQALHRLIRHYERVQPDTDVELLRRRLLSIYRDYSRTELIIWTYHMCREGRRTEALEMLQSLQERAPESPIVYLLKAAVYGELRQFTKKKHALAAFKRHIDGHESSMETELKDFEHVFGPEAVAKLGKRLAISSPSAHEG
ncbi:MAG: tetratricopeptide repeat protein [Chitinivibrionales bacterium]|nr:tetratricopeptide repeat protein [Chitinivibrionales bacterium]